MSSICAADAAAAIQHNDQRPFAATAPVGTAFQVSVRALRLRQLHFHYRRRRRVPAGNSQKERCQAW